ncbi:hypothetical protein AAD001_03950 [Colwelliaceae bacterium 6471]
MIVTDHFVYIHTSRHAGTFLNKLILNHVSGAKGIQYHGHLSMLPDAYDSLPVLGLVRNPWDWYVSMYFNYRHKGQYIFRIISEDGKLNFEETVSRYLLLGDNSSTSNKLLAQLVLACPTEINAKTDPRVSRPALCSNDFASYPPECGYYSWLFQLMYASNKKPTISIGRFEYLRQDVLQLFKETGTPISKDISRYLEQGVPVNSSDREASYQSYYSKELQQLVEHKDKYIIERFGYSF